MVSSSSIPQIGHIGLCNLTLEQIFSCWQNIFASSPQEIFDSIWHIKIPNPLPDWAVFSPKRAFCLVPQGRLFGEVIRTRHSEDPRNRTSPYLGAGSIGTTEWDGEDHSCLLLREDFLNQPYLPLVLISIN